MKAEKTKRNTDTRDYKRDAVALITEQGYKISDAARRLALNPNLLSRWKQEFAPETTG